MNEVYSLTISSFNTINRISGTSPNSYTYNVNWNSIIPEHYRNNKFLITFSFCSGFSTQSIVPLLIYLTGINLYNIDLAGNTNALGTIRPTLSATANQYFYSSVSDNVPITCYYPNSTQLNVSFLDITTLTTPINGMKDYTLTLSFSPIPTNLL
jgi:hypothetical protein